MNMSDRIKSTFLSSFQINILEHLEVTSLDLRSIFSSILPDVMGSEVFTPFDFSEFVLSDLHKHVEFDKRRFKSWCDDAAHFVQINRGDLLTEHLFVTDTRYDVSILSMIKINDSTIYLKEFFSRNKSTLAKFMHTLQKKMRKY